MKHILNDISQEDKNRILEQHEGGKSFDTLKFKKLLESQLGNVKPLVMEQSTGETQTLVNNVATEGIKNVTSQMISSPPFEGNYSGYVFGGMFNNVQYSWNCNGVEGMSGIRGSVNGQVMTETIENMLSAIKKTVTDSQPNSVCVGFYSSNTKFIIYTTTTNKPKCMYF